MKIVFYGFYYVEKLCLNENQENVNFPVAKQMSFGQVFNGFRHSEPTAFGLIVLFEGLPNRKKDNKVEFE